MKEYRVWISIEEHDTETDTYKDIDSQLYETEPYKTLEEAVAKLEAI